MISLDWLACCLMGHVPTDPELIDRHPDRGTVVVNSWCVRCGRDFLAEIPEQSLVDDAQEFGGPWETQPCLFCRQPTLKAQTAVPEMWPCSAVCPKCRETWERI